LLLLEVASIHPWRTIVSVSFAFLEEDGPFPRIDQNPFPCLKKQDGGKDFDWEVTGCQT